MNPQTGQLLLALTCVAVAAAVLVRRVVRLVRNPGGGCHSRGCGSCPSKRSPAQDGIPQLVELDFNKPRD